MVQAVEAGGRANLTNFISLRGIFLGPRCTRAVFGAESGQLASTDCVEAPQKSVGTSGMSSSKTPLVMLLRQGDFTASGDWLHDNSYQ